MRQQISRTFGIGLAAVIPFAVAIGITIWTINVLDSIVGRPFIGAGLLIFVGGTFALGLLIRLVIGRWLVAFLEQIIRSVPVVSTLYNTVRKIFSMDDSAFSSPILVEYPLEGSWAVGFQTGTIGEEITVYVPTTPNPTSGFLLLVPKSKVRQTEMSVSEAMQFVVSSGVSMSEKL